MKVQRLLAGMSLSALLTLSYPVVSHAQTVPETLQLGSSGDQVIVLQNDLNALGFTVGQADGQFGGMTDSEVKAFQKSHALEATGIVNASTWNALTSAVSKLTTQPIALAPSSSAAKNLEIKHIYYNDHEVTSPYGFTYDNTDYMPIWYVMTTMDKEGFTHTWSNNVWNITVPKSIVPSVDYSHIKYGKGSMAIAINGTVVARVMGVTHVDPSSKAVTTFMPIYYVEQALDRVGIQSTWNGNTWTMKSPSSPGTTGTNSFQNVDLRLPAPSDITEQSINSYLSTSPYQGTIGSPMTGLGSSFIDAQNTYGVNATYLLAHAILESGNGTSDIAQQDNNLFGYGAYTNNPGVDAGVFPSDEYAIRFEAWEVRNNYLNPGSTNYGGSPTLTGMSVHYASDPNWAPGISAVMSQVANSVGSSVNAYQQYNPSTVVPGPSSTTEPVYYVNGATATVQSDTYYGGVPYYSSMVDGENNMYFGPLQTGSFGGSVTELQQYLNQQINAGLTVDGQFGTSTETAVKNFEAAKGLPQDGIWSYSMWQTYIVPNTTPQTLTAGQSVDIDLIAEGMAGGYVVEWYHIPNIGWVDSQYIKLNNVYRVVSANPESTSTTISVYNSPDGSQTWTTLHSGDFVVTNSASPTSGMLSVQTAVQTAASGGGKAPGTLMTGYVSTKDATLVPQQ